jgi:hypothetical protein
MHAKLAVVFSALLLTSCFHKYQVPNPRHLLALLPTTATIYVVTPRDGRDHRSRAYEGSGGWTASAVADALRDRGLGVVVGGIDYKLAEALTAAAAAGADFIVYPQIAHWSDRLTEWSGIPDKLILAMMVYDVPTGSVLYQREIKASSRWMFIFIRDHPQDLLPRLLRIWAETMTE